MADEDHAEKSRNVEYLKKYLRFQPLRFVHILFSIVLTLYGAGVLLVVLTVKTHLSDYTPFLYYYLNNPVLVLILGSMVLIGLGCTGIITTALTMYQGIVTFGVLIFGLFMFEIAMGVVSLFVLNSADLSIVEALNYHVNNYSENSESMDFIQENLNCCGVSDFTDWNSTLGYVPGSCCSSDNPCGVADVLSLNETGCYEALKSLITYLINYLIIILVVLALLQITTMIITIFLVRGISDYRRKISLHSVNDNNHEDSDEIKFETAVNAKIKNPLGLRTDNDDNDRPAVEDGKNSSDHFHGENINKFHQTSSISSSSSSRHFSAPEVGNNGQPAAAAVDRENISRNIVYRNREIYSRSNNNNNNNRNKNSGQKAKPAHIPTQLPRAHRRFPIGF